MESQDPDELGYIIPSQKFGSFVDFINAIGIRYYEDYEVELVDGDKSVCFDNHYFLNYSPIILIYLLFGLF